MRHVLKGSVDQSVIVRVVDSADGTPETGVAFNTAGVDLWYRREGGLRVAITEVTLATVDAAHSDGGFIHISDGYCRLDLPDAAFATGADGVMVGGTFTGMVVIGCYVPLVDFGLAGQSAADLKDFADAGYDPATNKVEGVKLADVLTTYTGNTPQTGDAFARLGAPAGASVSADVATVKMDTAAILVDTGTTLDARIPAALVGGRIDANVGAVSGDATAADNLETAFDDTAGAVPWIGIIDQGTAQSASATELVLRAAAAFADNVLNGATVAVLGSTQGYWQFAQITAYVGATDTATVTFPVTPTGTITYKIIGTAPTPASAPVPVDIVRISGDATAADNAEAFFDGTGYAGTGNTIPTVTTVGTVNALAANSLTAAAAAADLSAEIADAVWDEAIAGHAGAGSTGAALSAAGSAGDPWSTALPGAYGAGTAGKIVGDNVNATISSRSSHSAADVWASATRTLTSYGTLVADIWASATRSLTDKAGFALSAAGVQAIWDALTAALTTVASIGKLLVDNLNATVSSRATPAQVATELATYDGPTHAETTAILTTALTESYPTDGATMTVAQALYLISQRLGEFAISGTTLTVKKVDGSTTAATYTLDSATSPTSITRAS